MCKASCDWKLSITYITLLKNRSLLTVGPKMGREPQSLQVKSREWPAQLFIFQQVRLEGYLPTENKLTETCHTTTYVKQMLGLVRAWGLIRTVHVQLTGPKQFVTRCLTLHGAAKLVWTLWFQLPRKAAGIMRSCDHMTTWSYISFQAANMHFKSNLERSSGLGVTKSETSDFCVANNTYIRVGEYFQ